MGSIMESRLLDFNEYTKNKTKYIEDLNVYYWVKNEPNLCFKLKKCLYLKHHGKDMSNSIYSEITTCIRETLDDMLNDEFDFMKTQSIYTPFEDEVGKRGMSHPIMYPDPMVYIGCLVQ